MSDAGDRLNPVLVKEFRQAVRSRLVVAVLILFLLVDLAILGSYLLLSPEAHTSAEGGRDVFMFLLSVLLITCVAFVPLYAGVRISLERNDANIDLFFVSTITPGAIIRGKYLTAMAITLLIFSACMPFIVFTYLLRGIDLPTIFYLLAIGFLVCAGANAVGVLAGCIPGSWFMRGLVALGMLFFLFYTIAAMLAWVSSLVFYRSFPMGWDWEFWGTFGTIVFMEVLGIGLLYVMSVALISPKASNRMLVPRIYVMGSWAVSGAVTALWTWLGRSSDTLLVWVVGSGVVFACMAVLALGERDTWSRRVRRTIPRNRLLRLVAFLLYTGSAGGVAWCTLMFGLTLLVGLAWSELGAGSFRTPPGFAETCDDTAFFFGYVLCYCLSAAVLRIAFLKNLRTIYLPFVALFLGIALSLGPYLVGFFVTDPGSWRPDSTWYLVGSPLILTVTDRYAIAPVGRFLAVWLLLCGVGSGRWFVGQWQRFVPIEAAIGDLQGGPAPPSGTLRSTPLADQAQKDCPDS